MALRDACRIACFGDGVLLDIDDTSVNGGGAWCVYVEFKLISEALEVNEALETVETGGKL